MGNFAENLNLGNRFRPPLIQDGRSLCENSPSRLRSEYQVICDKAGEKQGIMWVKPEEVLLANALW